ncbi:MAG: Asp-tRNA(Asn)/Glu-tRNA(Gln) amidotransferase subunit GatC [Acidobacteriota bacterium]
MKIDRDEARRIAALAHLEFDEAGLDRMAAEMTKILSYIDQLREVDVAGFEERAGDDATPMREDVVRPSLDQDLVSRNAPQWEEGCFVVPRVIGGE